MSIVDWIKKRKNIVKQESKGIDLAVYIINQFDGRKFTLRGLRKKYKGLSADMLLKLLREELESMLILYSYTTEVKTFTDKKGIPHAQIKLIGNASMMSRYNPLDITLRIATEA
jgi:hypothetical protein